MSIIFKYHKMKSSVAGEIKRPIAEVYIRSKDSEWIEFHPFIDSGADVTLLPYSFGLMLGLNKNVGDIKELKGVRGIGVIFSLPALVSIVKTFEIKNIFLRGLALAAWLLTVFSMGLYFATVRGLL